jgi:hypothetical protein
LLKAAKRKRGLLREEPRVCPICEEVYIPRRAGGKEQKSCGKPRCRLLVQRPPKMRPTPTQRYWALVNNEKVSACRGRDWLGATNEAGYGLFWTGTVMTTAHRFGLSLKLGKPLSELAPHALHNCDRPICQEPDHLREGTALDNMHDMIRKGRRGHTGPLGSGSLDDPEVRRLISELYATGEWTQDELGARYGVSRTTIGRLVLGQSWRPLD